MPRGPRTQLRIKDLSRIAEVSELRNSALRALAAERTRVFSNAEVHKAVVTRLFVAYLTAPLPPTQQSLEFFAVYRHLFEGGALSDIPCSLPERAELLKELDTFIESHTKQNNQQDGESDA